MNWDLVTIFVFVVALAVIRNHYRLQRNAGSGGPNLAAGDQSALSRAMETARRLEQRIETLERVLDEDVPGWRARARA
jgi:phage shock protein B